MSPLDASQRRPPVAFDPSSTASGGEAGRTDWAAVALTAASLALAWLVFHFVQADPARLTRFSPEHVSVFQMVDTTPQRLAFMAFLGGLILSGIGLRLVSPKPEAASHQPLQHLSLSWQRRLAATVAIAALVFGLPVLVSYGIPAHGAGLSTWIAWVVDRPVLLAYVGVAILLVFSRYLPAWVVYLASIAVAGAALAPPAGKLLIRISGPLLPWADQHIAGVFATADMLASGYRLFVDLPLNYGVAAQLALAAALRWGHGLSLGGLVHLTQICQGLCFGLFALGIWVRTRGASAGGRAAALLLLVLVAAPFLSVASQAVILPNQSGFRFLLLPAAVLVACAFDRRRLFTCSVLAATVSTLALLHNIETGIAITAGLGLGWLLRARATPWREVILGLLAGVITAVTVLAAAAVAHRLVLGDWPSLVAENAMGLAQNFGAGYGGLHMAFRFAALVIVFHTGTLVVRALAVLIGRPRGSLAAADVAIAGILLAWAPYYVNRADDWNLWSFLVVYTVLIAPQVARLSPRPAALAAIVAILLVPIPLGNVIRDLDVLRANAAMAVERRCADGLSLPTEVCQAHTDRVAELRRLAAPGDVAWLTAYPFVTLRLSHLHPPVATLDAFSASRTDADLGLVADQIAAVHPAALLLDGAESSPVASAVPPQVRAIHRRVATRAGYAACPLVPLAYWQAWLPSGTCAEDSPEVIALRQR